MKVLIVEDEEVLAKVFEEKFKRSNYDIKTAADGESALNLAKSFMPDAIVLDLVLPKKNGFDVLSDLKGSDSLKLIPVVVVSNLGEDRDIKKALALGATDYFVKSQHPINEIVEKIKEVLVKFK